jgi:hypothetical protein
MLGCNRNIVARELKNAAPVMDGQKRLIALRKKA